MFPNVSVNVTEEVVTANSSINSFVPAVILKTKTGPIGTSVLIRNERDFLSYFGVAESTTPASYAMRNYVKSYGSAYITRVAHSTAVEGTATISGDGEGETTIDLITISTVYKTDLYNGDVVSLKYDNSISKLYIEAIIDSKVVTSIKETLSYGTATAVTLEAALDKIISSFNLAQSIYVLTNEFTDKIISDPIPVAFTAIEGTIATGDSGNTGITDAEVLACVALYDSPDLGIDALLAPEFESSTVVLDLVSKAETNQFLAIASSSQSSLANAITAIASYGNSSSLAVYYPNVYYTGFATAIPASVAVLPAYIVSDTRSKWLAPAGVTRGTLSLISDLTVSLTDEQMATAYENDVPINSIKKISGTGYVVMGQKTAANTSTYQDRINVVRLVKYITREINSISSKYLFEPITDYVYTNWTTKVKKLLETIKTGNGLSDYSVQMDDTLNTAETKALNQLIGLVRVKPLEAAEYIEISFVITDTVNG